MRTIAKFADAKGTIQGKILSVVLSVLLTFCFMNVLGWNDFANADETENGETKTIVVEDDTEETGEIEKAPETKTDTSETKEITVSEEQAQAGITTQTETDEQTTGSTQTEIATQSAVTTQEDEEEAGPFFFEEATGTLKITGADVISPKDVSAYKAKAVTVEIDEVGYIENEAFAEFKSMTSLTITNVDHIGYSFRSCENLETLRIEHIGEIDTYAFYNPAKLKTLYIDDVETMGNNVFNVYGGATELTDITIKNANVGYQMFTGHNKLSNLTFENVDSIGFQAFMNCTGLTGDISSVLNGNVKELGTSAFLGCTGLTSLNLDGVEVGTTVFYGCTGLTDVTVENAKAIGNQAFTGCTGITSATISNVGSVGENCFSIYGNNAQPACTALTVVTLDHVETVGKQAFYACSNLNEAFLSDVDTIGQYAFNSCANLETVNLENVRAIENFAFWWCQNLNKINGLDGVKTIGGFAFYGCNNLDHNCITITELEKMGYIGAFNEIMGRVEAILSGKFNLDNVEEVKALTRDVPAWTVGEINRSDNWQDYDNGTQIMEQARWSDEAEGVAEVKVDAYYTGEKQMDYIFVADLSASMAQLGNPEDSNARFYDMQSKLLDMSSKLLSTNGYDSQVAVVTFGGLYNNVETSDSSGFMNNPDKAEEYIKGLAPLNENTDYGLGMSKALVLAKENNEKGRNTVIVFLSDGYPTVSNSGDAYGTKAAAEIKKLKNRDGSNIPIYGVLHSPDVSKTETALKSMNYTCDEVYASTDTESFGKAMNAAFAAVYGSNTVYVPVNAADFSISNISASAGEVSYANGLITWTLQDMPFASHFLTYTMTLTDANKAKTNDDSYHLNNGEVTFGENGAHVGLALELLRRANPQEDPQTPPRVPGQQTQQTQPTTQVNPIPNPNPDVTTPAATTPAATPAANPATPAAPAAGPAIPADAPAGAVIPDDANPLAAPTDEATEEGATIEDDVNPLAAFDPDMTEADCWVHWPMIAGLLATLIYGIVVVRRRNSMTNQVVEFEEELIGDTQAATEASQNATVQSPAIH